MQSALISVIIPIYKVEDYLDKCVESVVQQTYKNLEIILVDDGSQDGCPQKCDEWAKKDKRIKVIHKQNGGLSDARNAGLDCASGEFVCFIDSDDFVNESYVEILLNNLQQTDSDLSICNFCKVYDGKKFDANLTNKIRTYENDEVIDLLFSKINTEIVSACTKLYKKCIFNDLRFPMGRLHEDEFIVHKVLAKCGRIVYSTAELYNYFFRTGSITQTSTFREKNLDAYYSIEDRYQFFKGTKFEQPALKQLINLTVYLYCRAYAKKADKKILKFLREKFKEHYKVSKNKRPKQILFNFCPFFMVLCAKLKLFIKKIVRRKYIK